MWSCWCPTNVALKSICPKFGNSLEGEQHNTMIRQRKGWLALGVKAMIGYLHAFGLWPCTTQIFSASFPGIKQHNTMIRQKANLHYSISMPNFPSPRTAPTSFLTPSYPLRFNQESTSLNWRNNKSLPFQTRIAKPILFKN